MMNWEGNGRGPCKILSPIVLGRTNENHRGIRISDLRARNGTQDLPITGYDC